jgi:nucleotide-binding universal stress UspA family protein
VGAAAIVFAAIVAAISSSNSSILAASRVIYAMGRDGVVSTWLNVSHHRFYTPHRAIVTTGGLTAVLILVGLRVDAIVSLLAEAASFSFLVAYSLVHVSLVVFRRAAPAEYDPSFRLPWPLYPAVPILGVVLSVVVVSQMAPVIVLIGTGIVVLGVVWYLAYARTRVVGGGLLREAIAGAPTNPYRVVVPVANPATQRGLLRLAAASAHANADAGTPELVAVNVVRVEHPSPLQDVESERDEHQRELLENARAFAEEMDVHLRTRAVVASDVGTALLDVIAEEAPDEVLVGWDGRIGHGEGSITDAVLDGAACDVALVALRGDVGTPVGLVAPGPYGPAVARRAVEFATVEGTVPTLLAVESDDEDTDSVATVAEAAGLDGDEYRSRVVDADAVRDALSEFDTVCVGWPPTPADDLVAELLSETDRNVALVRGDERTEE